MKIVSVSGERTYPIRIFIRKKKLISIYCLRCVTGSSSGMEVRPNELKTSLSSSNSKWNLFARFALSLII